MVDATRLILRWPTTVHVWRTFGRADSGVLRYGFMHKDGVRDDAVNTVHPHYGVGYVLRGSGVYHDAAGKSWPMAPGTVFQRIPGRRHSTILDPTSRWAECYLGFGAELARSLIEADVIDPDRPVIGRALDLQLAERVLSGLVSLRVAGAADLPREFGHMLALLGDLMRVPSSPIGSDERLVAEA
nr:AraC family ligand binding domain-containing protein [Planctomycetota bacterium]